MLLCLGGGWHVCTRCNTDTCRAMRPIRKRQTVGYFRRRASPRSLTDPNWYVASTPHPLHVWMQKCTASAFTGVQGKAVVLPCRVLNKHMLPQLQSSKVRDGSHTSATVEASGPATVQWCVGPSAGHRTHASLSSLKKRHTSNADMARAGQLTANEVHFQYVAA